MNDGKLIESRDWWLKGAVQVESRSAMKDNFCKMFSEKSDTLFSRVLGNVDGLVLWFSLCNYKNQVPQAESRRIFKCC